MHVKDVPMVMVLLSYFSMNRAWRTDVRTDSHVTTTIFFNRRVNKFSKV